MAVLGFSKPNCDWLRILTSRKSFSGSSSQTLVFGGDKRQPEIRLRSQATTLQVKTILVAMATKILELATKLEPKSPVWRLKLRRRIESVSLI